MKKIFSLLFVIMISMSVSFAQKSNTKNFKHPVFVKSMDKIEIGFVTEITWNYLIQPKKLQSGIVYQDFNPDEASEYERIKMDVEQLQEYCFVYFPKDGGNKTPMIKEDKIILLDMSYDDALKLIN